MLSYFIFSRNILRLVPTQRIIGRLVLGPVVISKLSQALVRLIDLDTPIRMLML
jgi:hypothetical protein